MRLSGSDESFTHQVSLPHAMVGSSDPSWRERYWLSVQDTQDHDVVLTCGWGQYPNQDVLEAFAVVSHGGHQHNLRAARELSADRETLRVGPLSVEVTRPLQALRLRLDDNPSGVAFDLQWQATTDPILERPHRQVSRNRVTHDAIRYVQLGRACGQLTTPDASYTLTADRWWGERDHSWGTRPLPAVPGSPPQARPEWRMLMFCPFQFEDFGVHLYLYEDADGRTVHLSAGLAGPAGATGGREYPDVIAVEHDLRWVADAPAPTLQDGWLALVLADGSRLEFEVTARPGRAHLRGGGYEGWNGWFQGHWKGEDSLEHEVWDLTDESNLYRYAKASSDHLIEVRHRGRTGYGVNQYMVLPGYYRYHDAVASRKQHRE